MGTFTIWNYGICVVCKRQTGSPNEPLCPVCVRDRDQRMNKPTCKGKKCSKV